MWPELTHASAHSLIEDIVAEKKRERIVKEIILCRTILSYLAGPVICLFNYLTHFCSNAVIISRRADLLLQNNFHGH